MKTLVGSLVLLSSLSLVAAGCGTDEADDLTNADEALLTCGGWHSNGHNHRGHRHHRHHHGHGHGGAGGSQPHATGSGGTTGMGGGMAGAPGMGGAPADPRCAPLDGIVSWWHGDGDYDDAVGTNDGVTGGAASFAAGIDNQAFSLNGAPGAYAEVANAASLQITGSITIDAWINQTALGGRIVDKATPNDGYMMDVIADRLRMFIGTDAVLTPNPLPAGMFVHVAGVFNGNGLGVYVNGALQAESVTFGHSIISNDMPLHIGSDSGGGSQFVGLIDEPRVFNRALSADEIARLFWQGTNCQ
jgi:concanavalin A-like lectin/glucanase superfamily protein